MQTQDATSMPNPGAKTTRPKQSNTKRRFPIWPVLIFSFVLLFPLPQILAQSNIVQLPLSLFYNQSILNAASDAWAYVILALGLNIVVGYAGLLDLGYAAFFAIGAYTYAIFASTYNQSLIISGIHIPFWIMLFVSAGVTALFGIAFGAPTLRLRGDYLAIVTLGFGEIVPIVILNLDKLTGGTNGIGGIDKPQIFGFTLGAKNDNIAFYYLGLILVGFILFLNVRLRDSRIGRAWMAIREDELAAATMGINTTNTKLMAFALGAAIGGFAGTFYTAHLGFASYDQFKFSQSVLVLCMVILGGMGNMWGVMLGAVLLYLLQTVVLIQLPNWLHQLGEALNMEWLADFSSNVQLTDYTFFIYGLILVLFMLFRPEGLLPSARRKAELHPESKDISEAERQELYDVMESGQSETDTRGGG